jgi:hypothetical protein
MHTMPLRIRMVAEEIRSAGCRADKLSVNGLVLFALECVQWRFAVE